MDQYLSMFTSEELDNNNNSKEKLIDFIKSGEAMLLTGAGCSFPLYPIWTDFISILETAAIEHKSDFKGDKGNPLEFANTVKDTLGKQKYSALIYDTFKPSTPTHHSYHEVLCRMPFKGLVTTNYDIILEHALLKIAPSADMSLHPGSHKKKVYEFLQSLNEKDPPKKVMHLHGIFNDEESIILGSQEYSKYGFVPEAKQDMLYDQISKGPVSREEFQELLIQYGYEWPLRRKILWSLLATRRIFFVGFSASDPYFVQMFEFIKQDLSTYNSRTHFLLLRVTKTSYERDKLKAKELKEYGIETIFFFDEGEDDSALANIISELDARINIIEDKVTTVVENIAIATVPGDKELTNQLFELSKRQGHGN